jgi:hypothetical protein
MKMLADLDKNAGKVAYQAYTIKHGIESIEVIVPLKNAAVFETQIAKQKLATRRAVLEFVREHGGELKK